MTDRLTGGHPIQLTYTDRYGGPVEVSVSLGRVRFDTPEGSGGAWFTADALHFLADLASRQEEEELVHPHLMSECYWVQCPQHECPYTQSHTRSLCGRPTCRQA